MWLSRCYARISLADSLRTRYQADVSTQSLMAGGAFAEVIVSILSVSEKVNAEHGITRSLGAEGYKWLGVAFFALMGFVLYFAISKRKNI